MKTDSRGTSPIGTVAALSVAILIAAIGSSIGTMVQKKHSAAADVREPAAAQRYVELEDADNDGTPDWQEELQQSGITGALPTISTTTDPLNEIGSAVMGAVMEGYVSLKENNAYTPESGERLGETIAKNLRAPTTFVPYTQQSLTIDNDSSQERLLKYRADMRVALAPIVDFTAEPEFALYARFVATGETSWLDKLSQVASDYRTAEENLRQVKVPEIASYEHLRALNATGKYAETLERLVRFANDPLASMALLRTYNEAEREFVLAFDALAKLYVNNVSN